MAGSPNPAEQIASSVTRSKKAFGSDGGVVVVEAVVVVDVGCAVTAEVGIETVMAVVPTSAEPQELKTNEAAAITIQGRTRLPERSFVGGAGQVGQDGTTRGHAQVFDAGFPRVGPGHDGFGCTDDKQSEAR